MIHDDDIAEGVVVTIDPYPRWAMANVRQPTPPYMGTIDEVRYSDITGAPYAMTIRDERDGSMWWWIWAQGWVRVDAGGRFHRDELHLGPPSSDMLWEAKEG